MNDCSSFTKSEYQDLYDGLRTILVSIESKLNGTNGSFFSPSEKKESQAEYNQFAVLADKIDPFAHPSSN